MSKRNTRERERKQKRRNGKIVLVAVLLLLITLSLIGLLGGLGDLIKTFFVGVFGFGAYAILAIALSLVVMKGFGLVKRPVRLRSAMYATVLFLIIMVYLQVMTSHKFYSTLEDPGLKSYLSACYGAGLDTAGGVLFGLLAHPLLSLMGKYSAILLAVLFFVVLFFALFPMMRNAKGSAPAEKKVRPAQEKPTPKKKTVPQEKPLLLFVDKVRPGQKDAQKIKMKGFFSKRGEDPAFFDVYDNRPLYAPEGVVPAERPERIDPYSEERGRAEDISDRFFDAPKADASLDDASYDGKRAYDLYEEKDRAIPTDDFEDEELPDFVKRYAGDRAEANRKLYGRDDLSSIIPDEPSFDKKETIKDASVETTSSSQTVETPKHPTYMKPKARPGDIISDIHDLHRINEKSSREQKTSFLGEAPIESASSSYPDPIEKASITPPSSRSSYTQSSFTDSAMIRPENKETIRKEVIEEKMQPDATYGRVITPRDASMMKPKESTYEPISRPAPVSGQSDIPQKKTSSFFEEESDTFIRTRKPRSDIGGTHRTQNDVSEAAKGFISPKQAKQMDIEQAIQEEQEAPARPYTPPSVTLLKDIPPVQDEEGVEESAEMLVQALSSFNINSEVIDHKTGPTFTQFAVTLPDNMSINKLTPLEKDIKRKLKIEKNIRIIPSVPGLDAVGVEVPNKHTSMVGLRSIINSPDFAKEGKLCFAIGVDVSGRAIYGDLLKMPHLLVAGSTGSGKSVCLNVMICSILYHYSPEIVRFIMIDPKKVELSVYKNMPHMLMPSTVTEPDKAINALTWAVNEMERRYQVLMENDCRNIGEYNARQQKIGGKKMYYIVVIVDEMADLMATAKRDVEEKVNRITSKARAAGIHLVVATQRPSVDVITGTIKNNIPTRIAFKVTSFTDSKTILDRGGAESLFGYGDMLYSPPEGGDPIRLQGPFINIDEISEIVRFVKEHNDCRFDSAAEKIIQAEKDPVVETSADAANKEDEEDEYFAPALLYFIKVGQASISKLQIKYHIGYGRAARIVDTMAERGYLGPAEAGNKSRQVNMTLEEYYAIYGEDGIDGDEIL